MRLALPSRNFHPCSTARALAQLKRKMLTSFSPVTAATTLMNDGAGWALEFRNVCCSLLSETRGLKSCIHAHYFNTLVALLSKSPIRAFRLVQVWSTRIGSTNGLAAAQFVSHRLFPDRSMQRGLDVPVAR